MSLEMAQQMVMEDLPAGENTKEEREKRVFTVRPLKTNARGGREVVLEGVSTWFQTSDGDFTFDSEADPEKDKGILFAAVKRAFIGTKIRYTLGPDCDILRIKGTHKLKKKMLSHDPSMKNDTSLEFVTQSSFSSDVLTELLRALMFTDFPDKAVKTAGAQWKRSVNRDDGVLTKESTFTLAAYEPRMGRDCVKIMVEGAFVTDSGRMKSPPVGWSEKSRGRFEGEIWLDVGEHTLIERVMRQEVKGLSELPVVHGEDGQTIPVRFKIRSTVTYKLLEVEVD